MTAMPVLGTNFVLSVDGLGKFPILSLSIADLSANKLEEMTIAADGKMGRKVFVDRVDTAEFTVSRPLLGGDSASMELYKWHMQVVEGDYKGAVRNGSITGYDSANVMLTEYTFTRGWPKSYKWPALDANAGSILTEEVTVIADEWRRVK